MSLPPWAENLISLMVCVGVTVGVLFILSVVPRLWQGRGQGPARSQKEEGNDAPASLSPPPPPITLDPDLHLWSPITTPPVEKPVDVAPWIPPEIIERDPSPLATPVVPVDDRPFNLGLDFGTHSTKLVGRYRGEGRSRVLDLDEPTTGYPSFAVPSMVRIVDGKLFFGRRAWELQDGELFRSLKVDLLPPAENEGVNRNEFPAGLTPDLLVAAYLGWVLGQVKASLPGRNFDRFSLNVAAPMDHLENEVLKERYLQVIHAAWLANFGPEGVSVQQGHDLSVLRPRLQDGLSRPVPSLGMRRFEVLPETLAPLVSLFQDPRAKPGHYMMVDMGAGTTEFSVSRITEPDADNGIHCFADASVLIGGDQFQRNDETRDANPTAHRREEERLIEEFLKAFRTVWHRGFLKECDGGPPAREPWKQLRVLMAGGGLRRAGLETALRDHSPLEWMFPTDRSDYQAAWHWPARLDWSGSRSGFAAHEPREALPFLAVAHGLSLERQRWPQFCPPREVEVRVPTYLAGESLIPRYHEW